MKLRFQENAAKMAVATLVVAAAMTGCAKSYTEPADDRPAMVEQISGSSVKQITLTEKAKNRLGLQTAAVGEVAVGGQQVKTVPYSSLLYDAAGKTWVYTNPSGLVFVRQEIKVLRIEKGKVLVSDGPATGSQVVTVAVAELYGAETGVGK